MSVICETCGGIGRFASFLCGPADEDAPLTGEMACEISSSACPRCHGFGRLSEAGRRKRNADLAREDTRTSSISALARARASWSWSKQP